MKYPCVLGPLIGTALLFVAWDEGHGGDMVHYLVPIGSVGDGLRVGGTDVVERVVRR
ncbi:MAG: hypothetical protein IPI81_15045 [Flavobacteriales bacterium]|nr:hypothetical protein [Flavobacteriales bacterium]